MKRSLFNLLGPVLLSPTVISAANPDFIFWIRGSCGETVEGAAGSLFDDGTGGAPDFGRNRPGHTFEILLTQDSIVHQPWQTEGWDCAIGVEGPLTITDGTLKGTVSCRRFADPAEPQCLGDNGFYSRIELTGLPYGTEPNTIENHGALSLVDLGNQFGTLPGTGDYVVAKIRVSAKFSEKEGEVLTGRLYFTARAGANGILTETSVLYNNGTVSKSFGQPPLVLKDCVLNLKAVAPVDSYVRCDTTDDGNVDLSDAVRILEQLFLGAAKTICLASVDCNADRRIDVSDAIFALSYLFLGSTTPLSPFPGCGRPEGTSPEDCPGGSTRCS